MFSFAANPFKKILISFLTLRAYHSAKNIQIMPSALVVLPPGAEEMEFVGSVDILRRAGVTRKKLLSNCHKSIKYFFRSPLLLQDSMESSQLSAHETLS